MRPSLLAPHRVVISSAMPLVVPDDALFTVPHGTHGTIDASSVKLEGRSGQHNLEAHVLSTAKRSTDCRVDNADHLLGQLKGMCDLFAVLMGPLTRDLDGDDSVVFDVRQARLRLEISVLLMGEVIGALDHDVGCVPAGFHVALPDPQRVVSVRFARVFWVDEDLIGPRSC